MMTLLAIVGPTASGKTALAVEIAKRHNGAIICADSRTIYRGLDVGNAKPSIEERQGIAHYGLDIVEPDQLYSAFAFKEMAQKAVAEITSIGKLPIIVGGTGLYADALLFDMQMGPAVDNETRRELTDMTIEELQALLVQKGLKMPHNLLNKRHLTRALERDGTETTRRTTPVDGAVIYGLDVDKATLSERIHQRAAAMFADDDLYQEAASAASTYGWGAPGLSGNIYRLVHQLQDGTLTKKEALERFEILDRQLAKRQMTWFRRNPFIQWMSPDEIATQVAKRLTI